MLSHYFNIALAYVVIGFAAALFFSFVIKKSVFGNFWVSLAIAIVGAFLGGVIDLFLGDFLRKLSTIADAVNVFPALVVALLVLWLFSRFSRDE